MTHDIETLRAWIYVVVYIAAVATTAVPILYSFSPWRSRTLGKLFMAQAIAFAIAMDITALFSFWAPGNILVVFWIEALAFTAIAITTSALAIQMWTLNHPRPPKKPGKHAVQQQDVQRP